MVNRQRGQRHFPIRHTPDFSKKNRRRRPWMLLPLAAIVILLYMSGSVAPKPPATARPITPSHYGASATAEGPTPLQEILSNLWESQWGQETLDHAELLRQQYLLDDGQGPQAAAAFLGLLLAPTHPDAAEQTLLEQLAVFLGDVDGKGQPNPEAMEAYRVALETVYQAIEKGTD